MRLEKLLRLLAFPPTPTVGNSGVLKLGGVAKADAREGLVLFYKPQKDRTEEDGKPKHNFVEHGRYVKIYQICPT